MSDKTIAIVGMPKSGNTYLSRLLGDALDSPIRGFVDSMPLAQEGHDRHGEYVIYQNHLTLTKEDCGTLVPDYYTFSQPHWDGEHVIHIVRDPRGVAVSAKHYWEIPTLEESLEGVYGGYSPISMSYNILVGSWLDADIPVIQVRYEDLLKDTRKVIQSILFQIGNPPLRDSLEASLTRQSFNARKPELIHSRDKYPYGATIQANNLRRGLAGDWFNSFTPELNERAVKYFGPMLDRLGYPRYMTHWESTLSILQSLFPMPGAGVDICHTLYNLVREPNVHTVVELGTYHGRTAIAMGLANKDIDLYCVDNYAEGKDWANNVSHPSDKAIFLSNLERTGVRATLFNFDSQAFAKQFYQPIDLFFWDISSFGQLHGDWLAWRDKVKGRAVLRDTFDRRLGSEEVILYESQFNDFVIESHEPGTLILKRI